MGPGAKGLVVPDQHAGDEGAPPAAVKSLARLPGSPAHSSDRIWAAAGLGDPRRTGEPCCAADAAAGSGREPQVEYEARHWLSGQKPGGSPLRPGGRSHALAAANPDLLTDGRSAGG